MTHCSLTTCDWRAVWHKAIKPFSIQGWYLQNVLIIACICTCPLCAIAFVFRQKWGNDWTKHFSLRYVNKWFYTFALRWLMCSRAMAVDVRYNSCYTAWPFSTKQQDYIWWKYITHVTKNLFVRIWFLLSSKAISDRTYFSYFVLSGIVLPDLMKLKQCPRKSP